MRDCVEISFEEVQVGDVLSFPDGELPDLLIECSYDMASVDRSGTGVSVTFTDVKSGEVREAVLVDDVSNDMIQGIVEEQIYLLRQDYVVVPLRYFD